MGDWDFHDDPGADEAADDDGGQGAAEPAPADTAGETSPSDGLPGVPVPGYPGLRAGAFGSGEGLLGMMRVADAGGAARPPTASPDAQASGIDWGFIGQREASKASMYVPTDRKNRVVGHSGPTIGYGFDVGQHSPDDLKGLGLSQPIVDALTPYTQMQGSAAQAYVQAHPLTLTTSEVDAIDQAVRNKSAGDLAAKFDAASQAGTFASLPANTQTAIADLYHQYGMSDPARVTPSFWRQITGGDWQGAYGNLQDFHDHFPTRRTREAGLLRKDIDAGTLPGKSRSQGF